MNPDQAHVAFKETDFASAGERELTPLHDLSSLSAAIRPRTSRRRRADLLRCRLYSWMEVEALVTARHWWRFFEDGHRLKGPRAWRDSVKLTTAGDRPSSREWRLSGSPVGEPAVAASC